MKFYFVPSFPDSDWQAKKNPRIRPLNLCRKDLLLGTHRLWILPLLGTAAAFLFVSFCVLRTWLGTCQAWAQNTAMQKSRLLSVCPTGGCQLSGKFVFLSFGYLWEWLWILGGSYSLHTFWGCPLYGRVVQYNTVRSIYCLSQLRPVEIFKRIVFSVALWSEGGRSENWSSELDRKFFGLLPLAEMKLCTQRERKACWSLCKKIS